MESKQKFWSKVNSGKPNECWPWQGYRSGHYGGLKWYGQPVHAHRVAYILTNGPVPKGMYVCHHCDNPLCCNPAHLFAGVPSENTQDMIRKGRHKFVSHARMGESNPRAKLTAEQVLIIKQQLSAGEMQTTIARNFGVTITAIWEIKHGRNWAWLTAS